MEPELLLTLKIRHGPPGWADTDEEYKTLHGLPTEEKIEEANRWIDEHLARYTHVRHASFKLERVDPKPWDLLPLRTENAPI